MKVCSKTTRMVTESKSLDTIPGGCFTEKKKSRSVEVSNRNRIKIKNVVFAYYSQGADFWADPIHIASSVNGGSQISYDLRDRKLRIMECKIKFTSPEGTFTDSIVADSGLFLGCVGLTINEDGSFTTWWTQQVLTR